jgi:LysM repeat protein
MAKTRDPGRVAGSELLPRSLRYLAALPIVALGIACGGAEPTVIPTSVPTQAQVPVVLPSPTSSPAAAPIEHTVVAGESLSVIAEQYGVTVEAIVEANELTNPDQIVIGQVLVIPPAPAGGSGP